MEKHLDNVREENQAILKNILLFMNRLLLTSCCQMYMWRLGCALSKKNLQFIASIYTSVLKLVVRIANRFDAV